jgi:hypothetical protein
MHPDGSEISLVWANCMWDFPLRFSDDTWMLHQFSLILISISQIFKLKPNITFFYQPRSTRVNSTPGPAERTPPHDLTVHQSTSPPPLRFRSDAEADDAHVLERGRADGGPRVRPLRLLLQALHLPRPHHQNLTYSRETHVRPRSKKRRGKELVVWAAQT